MISQSLAYMMLGMVLLRSNVLNGMQSSRFYFSLAAGGYLLGMAMRGLRLWLLWRADFSPLVWQPTLIYELARLPLTLGHMGLILALWRLHRDGWVSKIFAALGQMALTNYLGQTLLTSLVFYGLSLYDGFNAYGLWLISLGIWVMQAMFSLWWLNRYRFGPVEWMLRSIAYGVRQPMRR